MSFSFCPFFKFIFKDELKDTISSKINEIQTYSSWRDFDLGLPASEIKSSDLRYEDVCKHLEIWEDLARLSVDLWRDFHYHGRFTFEGRYADKEYTRRLEDLGCECVDGRWRSVRRPQEESVQTNVFMWRLHALLAEQIEGPPGKTGLRRVEECPFCRVALTAADGPCGNCEATSEDILNQRIVEGRAQQAEKRREGVTVRLGSGRDVKGPSSDNSTQTEGTTVMVGVQCDIRGVSSGTQTEGTPTASCGTQWEDVHEVGASRVNLSGVLHHSGDSIDDFIGRKEEMSKMSKKSVEERYDKWLKEGFDVSKCSFCESPLEDDDQECHQCAATRDQILEQLKKTCNQKQVIESFVETKENNQERHSLGRDYVNKDFSLGSTFGMKNDSLGEKDDLQMDNIGSNYKRIDKFGDKFEERERSKANCNKVETEVKDVEVGKWRCGRCELINKYEHAKCMACGTLSKEGWWTCEQCTMLNSLAKEECGACGKENKYAQAAGAKGGQGGSDKSILGSCPRCSLRYDEGRTVCRHCERQDNVVKLMDEWECGKCHVPMSYGLFKCEGCGATRAGSGEWTCSKCTLKNRFTSNVCTVCGAENECLKVKYCTDCHIMKAVERNERCEDCGRKNSAKYQPGKWKCYHLKCGEMNIDGCKYCRKCHLDRFHSQKRGDSVRVGQDGDNTRSIWICFQCSFYNDLEDPVCTRCRDTRYKKRFCPRCKIYNDGSTINCDKCNDRLA